MASTSSTRPSSPRLLPSKFAKNVKNTGSVRSMPAHHLPDSSRHKFAMMMMTPENIKPLLDNAKEVYCWSVLLRWENLLGMLLRLLEYFIVFRFVLFWFFMYRLFRYLDIHLFIIVLGYEIELTWICSPENSRVLIIEFAYLLLHCIFSLHWSMLTKWLGRGLLTNDRGFKRCVPFLSHFGYWPRVI